MLCWCLWFSPLFYEALDVSYERLVGALWALCGRMRFLVRSLCTPYARMIFFRITGESREKVQISRACTGTHRQMRARVEDVSPDLSTIHSCRFVTSPGRHHRRHRRHRVLLVLLRLFAATSAHTEDDTDQAVNLLDPLGTNTAGSNESQSAGHSWFIGS